MESAHETNYQKLGAMLEKEAARVDEALRRFEEEKEETKKMCKNLIDGAYPSTLAQHCFTPPTHTEIQSLRDHTDKQMSAEVETLKAAQEEALGAVRAMAQETQIVSFSLAPHTPIRLIPSSCQACTSHLNNLKRKRDVLEGEEKDERAMKTAKFSKSQVAVSVVKVASVFTAGVIATWSALAFS